MRRRTFNASLGQDGAQGFLLAALPLPWLASLLGHGPHAPAPVLAGAAAAALALLLAAWQIRRRSTFARTCAAASVLISLVLCEAKLVRDPVLALLLGAGAILVLYVVLTRPSGAGLPRRRPRRPALARARSATSLALALSVLFVLLRVPAGDVALLGLGATALVVLVLVVIWAQAEGRAHTPRRARTSLVLCGLLVPLGGWTEFSGAGVLVLALGLGTLLWLLPHGREGTETPESWIEPLIDHPARILISTFVGLCFVGSALLLLPGTTRLESGEVAGIDAVFTAVSAVCVTGLIVLDTPHDLTFAGQSIVLLLIQLGGLGIMSISVVALHALGRRMSLARERVLSSLTDDRPGDLVQSFSTVLRFTFAVELAGAVLLWPQFLAAGDGWGTGAWRAVFTSVSAFCNAGFALQSDSLIPYADQPLVLHSVALLIIAGGLAPVTCLALPSLLRGRRVGAGVRLAVSTSAVLLVVGTVGFLAVEWDRSLTAFGIFDKIQHAWMQSVTLRTAGFNSVDIGETSAAGRLLMQALMFVGGSPGGTAGGVKTTTIAILVLAIWSGMRGRDDLVVGARTVRATTVFKAIAVVGSSAVAWGATVLCLLLTQPLPAGELLFEATSALGTVGLSTGITGQLDDIGKVVIVIAMFAGRVGPMTFLMLLGEGRHVDRLRRPTTHVPLT